MIPAVSVGMLRIVTNARVFGDPTPLPAALAFLRAVLAAPGVEMAAVGPEWPLVERLCKTHRLSGNDVTDAWIAAVVLDQHEHLVTFDRGFRRFLKASELTLLKP
jgi:predicted nucleic acid-binding protein